MKTKTTELILECKRMSENCLYSSTAFFIYLRVLRWVRIAFIAFPLVLESIATWNILTESDAGLVKMLVALCAFLAGLLPTVYAALKFDEHLADSKLLASEFKNLQDRFRQAALVASKKPFAEFEAEFNSLMDRLEQARKPSPTLPEWGFKRAQKKVKSGDYDFDVDLAQAEAGEDPRPTLEDKG